MLTKATLVSVYRDDFDHDFLMKIRQICSFDHNLNPSGISEIVIKIFKISKMTLEIRFKLIVFSIGINTFFKPQRDKDRIVSKVFRVTKIIVIQCSFRCYFATLHK